MVWHLSDRVLEFALNSIQDTLSHNVNLVDGKSCLRIERQTLLHVLNHCDVASYSDRYTWYHYSVLQAISGYIQSGLSSNWQTFVDIDGGYILPLDLASLTARPDIAVWNISMKCMHFLQLTVAFDTNLEAASDKKHEKYSYLASQCEFHHCRSTLQTIEVGSRGIVDSCNLDVTRDFTDGKFWTMAGLLHKLCGISTVSSYAVWSRKHSSEWQDQCLNGIVNYSEHYFEQ